MPRLITSGVMQRGHCMSPSSKPPQPAWSGHVDLQPKPCPHYFTAKTSHKSPSAELEGAIAFLQCRFSFARPVASREGNL